MSDLRPRPSPAFNRFANFIEALAQDGETVCVLVEAPDRPSFGIAVLHDPTAPRGFTYTVKDARNRMAIALNEYPAATFSVVATKADFDDAHRDGVKVTSTTLRVFSFAAQMDPKDDLLAQWLPAKVKEHFSTMHFGARAPRPSSTNESIAAPVATWQDDREAGHVINAQLV